MPNINENTNDWQIYKNLSNVVKVNTWLTTPHKYSKVPRAQIVMDDNNLQKYPN